MRKVAVLTIICVLLLLASTLVACNFNENGECKHNIVITEAVAATCEQNGFTEGKFCDKCQKIFIKSEIIPKTHNLTEDGICTKCGRQEFILELNEDGESYAVVGYGKDFGEELVGYHLSEIIPSEVLGKPVTRIADDAFAQCNVNASLIIPTSVTHIGERAFNECGVLHVYMPNSIRFIGKDAFKSGTAQVLYDGTIDQWCEIYLENEASCPLHNRMGTFKIGDQRLADIKHITLGDIVTSIGSYTFYGFSIDSITISNSVKTIGENAFFYVGDKLKIYNFSDIDIEGNREYYGLGLGDKTYTLTDEQQLSILNNGIVVVEDGVEHILTEYRGSEVISSIPEYVTVIDDYAFYGCEYVTSIKIPFCVWKIGESAFSYSNIASIFIPYTIESLGPNCFSYCHNLTSVTFDNDIQLAIIDGFGYCTNLKNVTFGNNCQIDSIGTSAFEGCSKLESIVIPASVKLIGPYAFYNCTLLWDIVFEDPENWTTNRTGFYEKINVEDPQQNSINLVDEYYSFTWKKQQ